MFFVLVIFPKLTVWNRIGWFFLSGVIIVFAGKLFIAGCGDVVFRNCYYAGFYDENHSFCSTGCHYFLVLQMRCVGRKFFSIIGVFNITMVVLGFHEVFELTVEVSGRDSLKFIIIIKSWWNMFNMIKFKLSFIIFGKTKNFYWMF